MRFESIIPLVIAGICFGYFVRSLFGDSEIEVICQECRKKLPR